MRTRARGRARAGSALFNEDEVKHAGQKHQQASSRRKITCAREEKTAARYMRVARNFATRPWQWAPTQSYPAPRASAARSEAAAL